MKPAEFLRELFKLSPEKKILIRGIVDGRKPISYHVNCKNPELQPLTPDRNWYFGVSPRHGDKVVSGITIFCDIDGVDEIPPSVLRACKPSLVIATGHGFHLYWYLDQEYQIDDVMKMVRLAILCLDGDRRAADPTRLLRLPESMNVKYEPHVPCEVVGGHRKRMNMDDIEDALISGLMAREWVPGARNALTVGFSAISARCKWPVDRAVGLIKSLCKACEDGETQNRIASVRTTFDKFYNDQAISLKSFTDIVGTQVQGQLLNLLGYDTKDGEVKFGEEVVGENQTILQDLVDYILSGDCTWAWEEGQLMEWNGKTWVGREGTSLASYVFKMMSQLLLVKGGSEKKLPALPKNAEGVARMVKGTLASRGFDPMDPDLLPFQNGVLHLETGDFRETRMQDHVKSVMPVDYDPKAKAPTWIKFLKEAVPHEMEFLQEWVGYCLKKGNPFERMVWAYGPQRTGKSTFISTIFKLFGPKAVTVSSQNVSQYQLATLSDAHLAVCTELSVQKFRTSIFKGLVTGDPITARHPYGRPFDIEFQGKLMWSSNELPNMDETEGVWPRIVMVEFNRYPKKRDILLRKKIMAEAPGVIQWGLEGYRRVSEYAIQGSWPIPDTSVDAVDRYRDFSEIIEIFIREEVRPEAGRQVTLREAFMAFTDFSKNMGHQPREFGAWFTEQFRRRNYQINDKYEIMNCQLGRESSSGPSVSWNVNKRSK
jgi:P4 family phage/plasmid primase-like protien